MISFFIFPIERRLPDVGIIILEIWESFNVTDDDDDEAPSTREIDDDEGDLMLRLDMTIESVEYMIGTTACERWNEISLNTAEDPWVNEKSEEEGKSCKLARVNCQVVLTRKRLADILNFVGKSQRLRTDIPIRILFFHAKFNSINFKKSPSS